MKKFFSIFLSIIFTLCLLCTLLLGIVRANFSVSKITELAGQLLKPVAALPVFEYEDNGLFYRDTKVISYAYYDEDEYGFDDFDFGSIDLSQLDLTNMDVNGIVQQYLDAAEIDVDPELVAEILSSPDVSQVVDKYAGQIIDYMTGASDELNINPQDITGVVNKAIDKYEAATGEVVDRSGLEQAVSTGIESAVPELTATLDTAKEENAEAFDILKKVNLLLSLKIFILAISVCVLLAVIIFLINMNIFVCFKFISIPAIIDGLILFIGAIAANALLPSLLKDAIAQNGLPVALYDIVINYTGSILLQVKICGIVATILGVILCVLGFMLGKSKALPASETSSETTPLSVQ